MFWSKGINALVAFAAALALGACSMQSLYANQAIGLVIETSGDSSVAQIKKQLHLAFAQENKKTYHLKLKLTFKRINTIVQPSGDITQKLQTGRVVYSLHNPAGEKLFSNSLTTTISFNQARNNQLARLIAAKDAKRKIIQKLSVLLQQRIIAFDRQQTP
jgi:hypothetical protein